MIILKKITNNRINFYINIVIIAFVQITLTKCNNAEVSKTSFVEFFDEQGFLVEKYYKLNDKTHGEKTLYYKNGNKKEVILYNNGLYQGIRYYYDSLGKIEAKYVERFSEEDNQWVINEMFYYNEDESINNTKSFYAKVKIKEKCFQLTALTSFFSNTPDSSRLIVKTKKNADTIFNKKNINYYEYCFTDEFFGKAELIYDGFFSITDSSELQSYYKVYGNENKAPSVVYSIIKNITIEKKDINNTSGEGIK
jgi:hypothetical protein